MDKKYISLIVLLVLGFTVLYFKSPQLFNVGSIEQGSAYQATTTRSSPILIKRHKTTLKTGPGTLGSVVITGSPAQSMTIYDATTTDINKRVSTKASSTLVLASFGVSPTVGTYTFDLSFYDGLTIVTSGAYGTSTITYR